MNKSVIVLCSSSHQDLLGTYIKIILNIITIVCLTYYYQNGLQKEWSLRIPRIWSKGRSMVKVTQTSSKGLQIKESYFDAHTDKSRDPMTRYTDLLPLLRFCLFFPLPSLEVFNILLNCINYTNNKIGRLLITWKNFIRFRIRVTLTSFRTE